MQEDNEEEAFSAVCNLPTIYKMNLIQVIAMIHSGQKSLPFANDVNNDLRMACKQVGYRSGLDAVRAALNSGMLAALRIRFSLLCTPRPFSPQMAWRHHALQYMLDKSVNDTEFIAVIERRYPGGGVVRTSIRSLHDSLRNKEVGVCIRGTHMINDALIMNLYKTIAEPAVLAEEWTARINQHSLAVENLTSKGSFYPMVGTLISRAGEGRTGSTSTSLVFFPALIYALIEAESTKERKEGATAALTPHLYDDVRKMVLEYIDHRD